MFNFKKSKDSTKKSANNNFSSVIQWQNVQNKQSYNTANNDPVVMNALQNKSVKPAWPEKEFNENKSQPEQQKAEQQYQYFSGQDE